MSKEIIITEFALNKNLHIKKIFNKNPKIKTKRAVIFAMYNKDGLIEDNLIKYLTELRKFSDYIALVSDSFIDKKEIHKLEQLVDYIDLNKHGEYDFGSYKRGWNYLKKQSFFKELEYITFCNDSVEYLGGSLENYFEKQKGNNAFGLTINNYAFRLYDPNKIICQQPHIQSFFITLSKNIYQKDWFYNYMNRIKKRKRKEEICIKYEVGLSDLIQKKGFKIESYFPFNIYVEPSGYYLNLDSPYEGERLFIKKNKAYKYGKINPKDVPLVGQGATLLEIRFKNMVKTLFSIKNDDIHKIITILGIKFKFKSKKLMKRYNIQGNNFVENIFSIKNSYNKQHKILTILGIKIKTKSSKQANSSIGLPYNDSVKLASIEQNLRNLKIQADYINLLQLKNVSNQKTILYVDWHIFEPDTNAGDRASYSYFKALLNRDYTIFYLPQSINPNTKTEYFDQIKDYGVEILADSNNSINCDYLKSWLQKNGAFFDYVYINRPDVYKQYEAFITKYLKNAKLIYQEHDIHFLRLSRMAEIEPDKICKTDIENMKNMELSIWKKMDLVLYFSDKEIEIVKSCIPEVKSLVVPLFLYSNIEKIIYNPAERKDLMFVGGFNHYPNSDAMRWFIKDIFQLVTTQNPDIKLNVVGSNCPQDLLDIKNENIIIHGYLSDEELQNLYNKTKIVISPLRYGAGVKGKIIEAMKNQIPVVTTDIGAEGINSDLLTIANSEEDFAKAIINLYNDDEKLIDISGKSFDFIKNNFSEEFINKLMDYADDKL